MSMNSGALAGRSYPLQSARVGTVNKLLRAAWRLVWLLLYRPSPTPLHGWRRLLLRVFGARIAAGAHPYPRARIWAPWNLSMAEHSCLANDVDCYCVAHVSLGVHATVSQYSYLCTASHDYRDPAMPLVIAPIVVERDAWVAADVFIGPGVKVGTGAVVGARSTVLADVPPWTVVAGSPARQRGQRPPFQRPASNRLNPAEPCA
jgi:putative colanic acid biosynthesis acetyltransferase WcaF